MSLTWAHLYAVGVALLTLIGAVILMQDRRTPQSTLAWLLAMVVAPYLAVPLFLLMGTPKIVRRHHRSRPPPAQPATQRGATFAALGGCPARHGHEVRLIETPGDAFRSLIGLCEGARESIDAEFYIVGNDAEGHAFLDCLMARLRDGVRVRLIVDRLGTWAPPRRHLAEFAAAGGQFLWFAPLVNRWSRGGLNLRNHRKVVIADGRRLFTGGMNVGSDYMRSGLGQPERAPFVDLALMLEGPAVADYAALFRADWKAAGGGPDETPLLEPACLGPSRVQLVPSGPDRPLDALHLGFVHAIHRADRRVWIATPYFLPTEALVNALSTAARRGLDVRLMVPRRSNHRIADFARGAYLRGLQADGCRVLQYPAMNHAKAGIVDEFGWVGTANFDVRSLLLNFETALMMYDTHSTTPLEDWFEAQFALCSDGIRRATLARRLGEGLFRLGAPLL